MLSLSLPASGIRPSCFGLAKAFAKCGCIFLCALRRRQQIDKRDHRQCSLLRPRRERPRRRAAEPSDEFAPFKANPHLPLPCEAPCEGALSRQDSTAQAFGPTFGNRGIGRLMTRRLRLSNISSAPAARKRTMPRPCCGPWGAADWQGSPDVRLPIPIAAYPHRFCSARMR
jgi:hypothetical protein